MAAAQAAGSPALPEGMQPADLVKDKSYIVLLVLGALVGVPVSIVAYFFLKLISEAQQWIFTTLPADLGFSSVPSWWSLLPLTLAGLIVGLTITYLPGTAGHEPANGLAAGGTTEPIDLPGIAVAAVATLALGAVLGPEAPLIAIGGGLAVLIVRLIKRDAPTMAVTVIGVAGSFAAISTLFGSPIPSAFLLMEVAGLGGGLLSVVLLPGLLAAGVGTLIFVGLGRWTGFGTFSLAVPNIPPFTTPTVVEFLWAIAIGLMGAILGTSIRRVGVVLRRYVRQQRVIATPIVGLLVGVSAMVFVLLTDRGADQVLFSGQDALPGLIEGAATWTVGSLIALIVCKSIAYGLSLSAFRGGPTFPGMFIGAAGGIALSHLAGLPMIAGAAMGIGAMTTVMLNGLPLSSVLLAVVFLEADGLALTPLIIVAVVVAYVAMLFIRPNIDDEPANPAAHASKEAAPNVT
jgi:H+/Cl- antiporter ClcA